MAALVHANESQERVERNRGERVGGHAIDLASSASGTDDGYPGGELAKRVAKVRCSERSGCHVRSFSRYHTAMRVAKSDDQEARRSDHCHKSLEGQKCAGEFAFVCARFHYGGKDCDFHAKGADSCFLRRVAAVDDESPGEIGVEFRNRGGRGTAASAVAKLYADFTGTFVIDRRDASQEAAIRALGMKVAILPTVMKTRADKRKLARALLTL